MPWAGRTATPRADSTSAADRTVSSRPIFPSQASEAASRDSLREPADVQPTSTPADQQAEPPRASRATATGQCPVTGSPTPTAVLWQGATPSGSGDGSTAGQRSQVSGPRIWINPDTSQTPG